MSSYVDEYIGSLDSPRQSSQQKAFFADSKYYIPAGSIAATTSIQTANQLGEVNSRLNAGVKGIDIAPINPEILEQIPEEHFREMNRLSKLSNAEVSMHGPILDLVGFGQNRFDHLLREQNERFAVFALDRAHSLNPEGNTFMNVHINNQMIGDQWRAASEEERAKAQRKDQLGEAYREAIVENRFGKTPAIREAMGYMNRDTGEIGVFRLEEKEYPDKTKLWTPEERLDNVNRTSWDNSHLQVFQLQKEKRDILKHRQAIETELGPLAFRKINGIQLSREEESQFLDLSSQRQLIDAHDRELNQHIGSAITDVFHKLKYTPVGIDPESKREAKLLEGFRKNLQGEYSKLSRPMSEIEDQIIKNNMEGKPNSPELLRSLQELQNANHQLLQTELSKVGRGKAEQYVPVPELFVPTNHIAEENTVKTISNAMMKSYEKYGEHAPIFALENYQPHFTLGTSQDLKNVMEKSRAEFAKKLMDNKGLDKSTASKIAEKHIGATWDVGHINFMKRHGFDDSDVLEETKRAAPFIKQLHITDNFGFSDAHMPPGMGGAPIEEQMKILKEKGFKFENGRVIVEAGSYVATFKENPQVYSLEHFNSPLYSGVAGPTWNQLPQGYGGYGTGFGNLLPDVHFRELYGSGFSTLPRELGGQVGGGADRFSGTPLQ